ncbi:hypothetical protein [Candidatus Viridilinea mediisalina]|uniref:AAA+ ATPase domain-containing protein n=1 Tax=Candidatus Viridilinea mediisalina TaxID=2024553 RepID=A0A2A6RLQ5_9CHLR|nr:hypothetical protein [Candidatus Viridilinea mediisalina]PDW03841.1 hypothetical protein CJ255_06720 [Candidatus Viridilinea mediisalina]
MTIPSIAPRFMRAIHIRRDFRDLRYRLDGYQVTPLVRQATLRVLAGLQAEANERAFSVVGPYGAGKSAFALFLAHYLQRNPQSRQQLLASLGASEDALPLDAPQLLAVPVAGNHSALRAAVLLALREALQRLKPQLRDPEAKTLLAALAQDAADPHLDPQRVAERLAEVANLVQRNGQYGGVLLIIDELGQFLDYAARHDEERDLFLLQALAEVAARSGTVPCLVVTILHQAFERYTLGAGPTRRMEWAKVQGRFADLPFQEPATQMIRMVAHALRPHVKDHWQQAREAWAAQVATSSTALGLRPPEISAEEWPTLLAACYPLHPTVLVALPQLFRQLAQNERSLFAFLHSDEPWSLRDLLTNTNAQPSGLPIYRLPHLYAYVEHVLGPSLFGRARGQRWAELAEARAMLASDDPMQFQVLTVVGTIGALERAAGLRADRAQVAFALADATDGPAAEAVYAALDALAARRMLSYRHHRNSYILWEGSDLDLDDLTLTLQRDLAERVALPELLERHADCTPRIARRYSYRSGATRTFALRFVAANQLRSANAALADFDGELLHVVANDEEELAQALDWASAPERQAEPQRIVVLPRRPHAIRSSLLEVAALRGLLEEHPALEHDRPARREVAGRLLEAQQQLSELISATYGGEQGRWFHRHQAYPINGPRDLDELLSAACDATYPAAPRIWNELIVRRQLSSAAAKARRNLIEAMLERADQADLGFSGFPPERAMYESILRQGGLHRYDEALGRWRIGPPSAEDPLGLQPAWSAMEQLLEGHSERPLPLTELLGMLERPPYGLKAGLSPLLFFSLYAARSGEISLYERGNYVTTPDLATYERLLTRPDGFGVRLSRADGARALVYRHLAQALAPQALAQPNQPALLTVALPLLRSIKSLPSYSLQTKRIGATAQAVRRALREARSPDELLFTALPRACGLAPFPAGNVDAHAPAHVERFAACLKASLQELQSAYQQLLTWIADAIQASFKLTNGRSELLARYQAIAPTNSNAQLRALGIRLETADPQGLAWAESIAALIAKRPPELWSDSDLPSFEAKLSELAAQLRAAEELALIAGNTPSPTPLLRIGLTASGGSEQIRVISRCHDDPQVAQLQQELHSTLTRHASLSADQRTAALAMLLEQLLGD